MKDLTIWQKLTIPAAVLSVVVLVSYPVVVGLAAGFYELKWLVLTWIVVGAVLNVYLNVFALWHWRTRYAGKRPFVWILFFVFAPLCIIVPPIGVSLLFVPLLAPVCYFFRHLLPDFRQRGPYATSAPQPVAPLPLPPTYEIRKSLCFVVGWGLVYLAVMTTLIGLIAWEIILYISIDTCSSVGPQRSSQELANLFVAYGRICRIGILGMSLLSFLGAIGAIFLYVSQRMKWQLVEHGSDSAPNLPMLAKIESAFDNPAILKTLAAVACLAFGAVFAAIYGLAAKTTFNARDFDEARKIVVAFSNLTVGSILTPNNIATKSFVLTNLPEGFIVPQQCLPILGLPINRPVKRGEPIIWPDVFPLKQ